MMSMIIICGSRSSIAEERSVFLGFTCLHALWVTGDKEEKCMHQFCSFQLSLLLAILQLVVLGWYAFDRGLYFKNPLFSLHTCTSARLSSRLQNQS